MKKLAFLFFICGVFHMTAQTKYNVEAHVGYAYNDALHINQEKINSNTVVMTQLGVNVQIPIYRGIYGETGIYGKLYFSSGEVGESKYKGKTLRLDIPLLIGYHFFEKYRVASGVSFSNNRDFEDVNISMEDNMRINFLLKGSYAFNKKWQIVSLFQYNMRKSPDFYLLNEPKSTVSIGVSYTLN